MRKRTFFLVFILVAVVVALICVISSRKHTEAAGVDDKTVQNDVDQQINQIMGEKERQCEEFGYDPYNDYLVWMDHKFDFRFDINHDVDMDTHTDHAIITLEQYDVCYNTLYEGEANYQFNRLNGKWERTGEIKWNNLSNDSMWKNMLWDNYIGEWSGTCEIYSDSVNLAKPTIYGRWTIVISDIGYEVNEAGACITKLICDYYKFEYVPDKDMKTSISDYGGNLYVLEGQGFCVEGKNESVYLDEYSVQLYNFDPDYSFPSVWFKNSNSGEIIILKFTPSGLDCRVSFPAYFK